MIRIPINTTIIGELRCDGATRVDARVEGVGNVKGVLLISNTCVWVGDITADKIIVEGTVEGHIIAREKIQLSPKAKVTGKITAPEMYIAPGAMLNCEVDIAQLRIPVGLIRPAAAQPKITRAEKFALIDELAARRQTSRKSA